MKCFITGKELKEDYQTLGWIGNDKIKREMTPEMAVKIIRTHLDYLDCQKKKGKNAHYLSDCYLLSTCKNVIMNKLEGETTFILLPFFDKIMSEFEMNLKALDSNLIKR